MQHADPDDAGNLTCWYCHRVGEPSSFQSFVQTEWLPRRWRPVRITYYQCPDPEDCMTRHWKP